MLRKTFQLKNPLDPYIVPLELFLTDISRNALQSTSGTYMGTGVAGLKIPTPFFPKLIIISQFIDVGSSVVSPSGAVSISLATNAGISFSFNTSTFKKNAVISYASDGFTLGTSAISNSVGLKYVFFAVG